jgi:hypothetical protein
MAIRKRIPIMKTKPITASPPAIGELSPSRTTINNPKETIKKLNAPMMPIPANG